MSYLPAILEALRFHGSSTESLARIPERAWPGLLDELDAAQLTLAVAVRGRDAVPAMVRARLDRNLRDNTTRHDRLLEAHRSLDEALRARGIDYVVLKGITQWRDYCDDRRARPQYDIDLYVPETAIAAAAAVLKELGYEPAGVTEDPGADHLPPLIRRTGWTWRHDYFDPEMPLTLELHFRFWNPDHIGFDVTGVSDFWNRRAADIQFPALNRSDGLTYASLHLIRHLLGGDLKVRHAYEIGHFLERSADDHAFWKQRESSCPVIEGIAFRLARDWFQCRMHPAAADAVDNLPGAVERWFALFGKGSRSGKNELWLHLALIENRRDRLRIARRRIFPVHRSRVVYEPHLPEARARASCLVYEASFLARRAAHHVQSLAPLIRGAWLWRGHLSPSKQPAPLVPLPRMALDQIANRRTESLHPKSPLPLPPPGR
ncbi:MAG TPA: nucleotidyltransferase family protein [Bryobacteraceae bacterium]|nr:nucleotidyltransferase family protein [Bryobacteraceae bacterium]